MSAKKLRPILRWHGGKFRLAEWIISFFPEHRIYVEPFGGAGSVLLKKSRSYGEVYNDLDDQLYNLFYVIRNHTQELHEALKYTPFARREFDIAHMPHPNPVERARRLVIRSYMGFGADSASNPERSTGFRSNSNKSGTTPAHDWVNYIGHLETFAERFRGVVLENRDAFECMSAHDTEETLHYIDPPYVFETRKRVGAYKHEFDEHERLLDFVKGLKGSVIISGYENDLYNQALAGWVRTSKEALADGAQKRTEVLWLKTQTQK